MTVVLKRLSSFVLTIHQCLRETEKYASSATRCICQMQFAPALNQTRHEGSVICVRNR